MTFDAMDFQPHVTRLKAPLFISKQQWKRGLCLLELDSCGRCKQMLSIKIVLYFTDKNNSIPVWNSVVIVNLND